MAMRYVIHALIAMSCVEESASPKYDFDEALVSCGSVDMWLESGRCEELPRRIKGGTEVCLEGYGYSAECYALGYIKDGTYAELFDSEIIRICAEWNRKRNLSLDLSCSSGKNEGTLNFNN